MREYQAHCEQNPDFVFTPYGLTDGEAFKVIIPRSAGSIVMWHNKPVLAAKLMPATPGQKRDEFNNGELEALSAWLTGGSEGDRSEETDIYGVVQLSIDLDVGASIVELATLGENGANAQKEAVKEYQNFQKKLVQRTQDALEIAKQIADKRVKRALKVTHMNLMRQYETMKSQGMGAYAPSVCEAVGAHILKEELDKSTANRRQMIQRLDDIMKSTTVVS